MQVVGQSVPEGVVLSLTWSLGPRQAASIESCREGEFAVAASISEPASYLREGSE